MIKSMKSPRRLAAVAVFAIVAMSAFGFAATNTVQGSNAGDGTGVVSGGEVQNIEYTVAAAQITGVEFDYLNYTNEPTYMAVTLVGPPNVADSGCSEVTPDHWSCSFAATSIAPVTGLRVTTWD
jgi:predicted small secreted protein